MSTTKTILLLSIIGIAIFVLYPKKINENEKFIKDNNIPDAFTKYSRGGAQMPPMNYWYDKTKDKFYSQYNFDGVYDEPIGEVTEITKEDYLKGYLSTIVSKVISMYPQP